MANLAALRAAVFSPSAKNLRGADNRPPAVHGLNKLIGHKNNVVKCVWKEIDAVQRSKSCRKNNIVFHLQPWGEIMKVKNNLSYLYICFGCFG